MHVDDFIDRYTPLQAFSSNVEREGERYARFVLMLLRMPAALQLDFKQYMPKLFCRYQRTRYRVVFASRMGWIGITDDAARDTYCAQVDVSECSEWGPK